MIMEGDGKRRGRGKNGGLRGLGDENGDEGERGGVVGRGHLNALSELSNGFPRILSGAAMAASHQSCLVRELPIINRSSSNKSETTAEI